MNRLDQLFDQFLRERTYINNVTASTCEWYETAWKAFKMSRADAPARLASAPPITKSIFKGSSFAFASGASGRCPAILGSGR